MVAFDVDVAVANFLADPTRNSLELAHMTTGQRKSTKKLVAEYPGLRCESYGFGAERQLHLFKKGAGEAQAAEDSAASVMTGSSSQDKLATVASSGGDSPMAGQLEPVELRVHNTFIHMKDAPVDLRAVQSMPHGMFRQCLQSEAASQSTEADDMPAFPSTPSSVSSEPEMEPMAESMAGHSQRLLPFSIGTLVMVEGLVKAPGFNGRSAVVQGFDEATGRYDIVLASTSGSQQAKIKEENLRMVCPCP
jgi:hypothetical protein